MWCWTLPTCLAGNSHSPELSPRLISKVKVRLWPPLPEDAVSRWKVTGGSQSALAFLRSHLSVPWPSWHAETQPISYWLWATVLRTADTEATDFRHFAVPSLVVPSAAPTSDLPTPTPGLHMQLSLILSLPCRTFTSPSISHIWERANFYNKSFNPIILSMFLFLWLAPGWKVG